MVICICGDNMFILETSACTSSSVLATILFIKKLTKVLSIIVPAILIVLLSIDFVKAVIASDDEQIKRAQKLALKRIVYGVVIFFIPMIVNVSFSLLDSKDVSKSCFSNADDIVVSTLREAETQRIIEKQSERNELIQAAKDGLLSADTKLAELRDNFNNTDNSNSSSNPGDSAQSDVGSKVLASADKLARAIANSKFKYVRNSSLHSSYNSAVKDGYFKVNCATYASWAYIDAGVFKSGENVWFDHGKFGSSSVKKKAQKAEKRGSIKIYTGVNKKMSTLLKNGSIKPGDILGNTNQTHTFIYAGIKDSKHYVYSVGSSGKDGFTYSEIYHKSPYGSKTIGTIIRPLKAG